MDLIIGISGCSGGMLGPQGMYPILEKLCNKSDSFRFMAMNTIPEDMRMNIDRILQLVHQNLQNYEHIYLMGYSMGGGVAAVAASEINQNALEAVNGLILLNSQTEGLDRLKTLKIPVLFYQGKEDTCFPSWEKQSIYTRYQGAKKLVEIEKMDHDCLLREGYLSRECSHNLAKDILKELSLLFLSASEGIDRQEELVLKALESDPLCRVM